MGTKPRLTCTTCCLATQRHGRDGCRCGSCRQACSKLYMSACKTPDDADMQPPLYKLRDIFERQRPQSWRPRPRFLCAVVQFRRISALKVERFLFIFLLLQRSMRICLVAILNGWRILANDGAGGRERKIASIEDRSEKEEAAAVVVVAGTKSKNK